MLNSFRHFSRWEKILLYCAWVLSIGLLTHAGMSIYFYRFYERPSVTWGTTTFPLEQNTIHQGDPIEITVERCSKEIYQARISREIIDGIAYTIPVSNVKFLKGCVRETRFIPEVSKVIPPGKYYIRNFIEIDVRWLYFMRVDKYETQTEIFTIQ